jgi:hypothetical protein
MTMVRKRTAKDGPFCWQNKATLRRIAEACDGRSDRAMVLAIYFSLTWIASDRQNETFSETKSRIAERAGVSYRKAADVLAFLSRLGVIGMIENVIEGTKERGPNTYSMLGTACATSGTECLTLGTDTKQGSVPRLIEESLEQSSEESPEQIAPVGAIEKAETGNPARKPCKPRERNPLLDALVALDGSDPTQATPPAWGQTAKALKDIRTVCPNVTSDEIQRRAVNYRAQMPDAIISSSALAKHWAKCDRASNQSLSRPEPAVKRINISAA